MSRDSIEKSNKFADERNLPRYEYVIHPRVTGFNHIFDRMYKNEQIDCIHDVTVGYRGGKMPERETDFLAGNMPNEIHFYIDKFSCEKIFENKNDKSKSEILEEWICDRWKKKEEFLKKFYQKQEEIEDTYETKNSTINKVYLTLYPTFWFLSLSLIFFLTYYNFVVRSFLLIAFSFYLYHQFMSNNIDNFIINS